MDKLYMDIKVEEPTIEYELPKLKGEPVGVLNNPSPLLFSEIEKSIYKHEPIEYKSPTNDGAPVGVVEDAKPFMYFEVPEPTIEMPMKRRTEDEELYVSYLEYVDFLLKKYGEEWKRRLTNKELSDYVTYYTQIHTSSEEEILNKFGGNYTR